MPNRSILIFSIGFGIAMDVTLLFVGAIFRQPGPLMLAFAALGLGCAILLAVQQVPAFRDRFMMAFGSHAIGWLSFGLFVAISRGLSVPLWSPIGTLLFSLVIAALSAVVIAAISRPWQTAATA
jgi:hypothetical protein